MADITNNNIIIVPDEHIPFQTWAQMQAFLQPGLGWPSPAPPVEEWWEWAENVSYSTNTILANVLMNVPLPTKEMYPTTDHWRVWATQISFQLLYLN